MQYLLRTTGINNSAHYWVNGDTACKMWSSGGISKTHKYSVVDTNQGHFLCGLCHDVMPLENAPPRRPPKTEEQKALRALRKKKKSEKKATARKKQSNEYRPTYRGDAASDAFLESYEWRRVRMQALKKHGAICQCCGASPGTGAVINVDHIKPRKLFPQLALDVENLQVLCHECNHGKGNWDMTDWRPVSAEEKQRFDFVRGL